MALMGLTMVIGIVTSGRSSTSPNTMA